VPGERGRSESERPRGGEGNDVRSFHAKKREGKKSDLASRAGKEELIFVTVILQIKEMNCFIKGQEESRVRKNTSQENLSARGEKRNISSE